MTLRHNLPLRVRGGESREETKNPGPGGGRSRFRLDSNEIFTE